MTSNWQVSAATNCGLKRTENLDYHYISPDQRLLIVSDGSEKGGAAASKLGVERIAQHFIEVIANGCESSRIYDVLIESFAQANEAVRSLNKKEGLNGFASIVVAYRESLEKIHIAHAGDARAFRLKNNAIEALTQDHRISNEIIRQGGPTAELLQTRKGQVCKDILIRGVGLQDDIDVEYSVISLEPLQWFVLSTDGLHAIVTSDEIIEILKYASAPAEACEQLIEETLALGAPDNVTVICARQS